VVDWVTAAGAATIDLPASPNLRSSIGPNTAAAPGAHASRHLMSSCVGSLVLRPVRLIVSAPSAGADVFGEGIDLVAGDSWHTDDVVTFNAALKVTQVHPSSSRARMATAGIRSFDASLATE
jgi:hypothetical protein